MEKFMKVILKMIYKKEKEKKQMEMEINMKEIFMKVKSMDMEL